MVIQLLLGLVPDNGSQSRCTANRDAVLGLDAGLHGEHQQAVPCLSYCSLTQLVSSRWPPPAGAHGLRVQKLFGGAQVPSGCGHNFAEYRCFHLPDSRQKLT